MTPEQVKLIKLSFVPLMSRKLEAGKLFYQRLFEIAPETRSMFKPDIDAQAEKLMQTLGLAISSLNDMPTLLGMLKSLGRQHVAYGVKEEHYAKVGAALLWTLEKMLGDAFTDEARIAWTDLYKTVAAVMYDASQETESRNDSSPRVAAANK